MKETKTCYVCGKENVSKDEIGLKKKLIDKKVKVRFLGNIHKCYDSNYFMPMFYRNFENTDFVLQKTSRTEFSSIFFKEYFNNRIIDIPETYRGKKK